MPSGSNSNRLNGAHGLALRREACGLTQHRLAELARKAPLAIEAPRKEER
jgi:hypothetical protein